jgi:hypothetical protein
MTNFDRDPAPDPQLKQLLGSLGEPPMSEVDWDRLRGSIRARAELPLARRRRAHRVRPWLRAALPTAAAAGLALAVATNLFGPGTPPNGWVAGDDAFHPVIEEVLGASLSEFEVDLLFGQVSADMLAVAAVDAP